MSAGFGTWERIIPELLSIFSNIGLKQIYAPGRVFTQNFPEWKAAWKDRKESSDYIDPRQGAKLTIKFTSTVQMGWDDWNWEEFDTGLIIGEPATGKTDLYQTASGMRKFTINAQFMTTEETDQRNAHTLMEQLQTRMGLDYALQRLLAVNVDYSEAGVTRDMTKTMNGHRWCIASCDFTFVAGIIQTEPNPTGWIATVIMSSHEQNNGVDVQASLRQINERLPP